ncbi:MAG: restriction endonuclease subunit S, partial [Chloroflexota bacterium]|nr:restriction endonuclease subunit S [Chloroflexota bacterium]
MKSKKEYKLVRFGDVVRSVRETENNPLDRGLEICVGIDNIEPENLHITDWGLVKDGTSFTRVFRKGQVLFVRRRAYQRKVALAEFEGICSGDIIVMEAIADKLIPELLPFVVQSENFYRYAINTSAGSLSPRTKWKHLAKFQFQLPPIEEQRRIAKILWTIDNVTESYKSLLNDFLLFRTKEIDRLFDSEQGSSVKLKNLIISKPEYGINAAGTDIKESAPRYIRITDIDDDGRLSDEEIVGVDSESYEDYILQDGDLLFARTGTVGKTYLYEKEDGFCVFAGYLIRFKLDKSKVLPKFLFYYTKSSIYKKWVLSTMRVGVQPNINATE